MGVAGEQYVSDNLAVMSVGFLLKGPEDAVIWRGPRKNGLIKQFLRDVDWGELDYLVIDTPPGTSDEHLSVVQYLSESDVDGAIVLTTPQKDSVIFPPTTGGGEKMAADCSVPFLGKLPLDPRIGSLRKPLRVTSKYNI
nr:hypothetical protein BaRGS_023168 [Batillaria attramentaria]